MNLRQLEYFVAVAEDGSFTHAAARCHVAQPGISAQIRRLERELGHELLDRSGRTARVTDAGAALLPLARAALATVADIAVVSDELRGLLRGHVAVGTMAAGPAGILTATLADFHAAHPGVDVSLIEAPSADLVAGVRAGTVDLAVAGFAVPPRDLEVDVVHDDVLAAAGLALAGRRSITLADLAEHDLVCLPGGTGIRASLDEGCAALRLRPRVSLEASRPEVVADLAARGLGVAVLPEAFLRTRDDLAVVRITRPVLRARVAAVWRRDRLSPAARAVVSVWQRRRP
jgi:DNA-binding transcriptional LysR family regulator